MGCGYLSMLFIGVSALITGLIDGTSKTRINVIVGSILIVLAVVFWLFFRRQNRY